MCVYKSYKKQAKQESVFKTFASLRQNDSKNRTGEFKTLRF